MILTNLPQKRTIILFLFTFILFVNGFSQTDFRPGYYITWGNDTIYGLVDYRGEIRNSRLCEFKKDENSVPIQFEPSEIQAYRFINSKYYISKKIKIDGTEKQVFVEYLLNGIINLYFYRDFNNYLYLFEGSDGELLALTNEKETEYIEGKGRIEKNTYKYIGQLKAKLADCSEIRKDIDRVALDHNSLINITKEYHDYMCDGEKCIIYEKKVSKSKIKIAPVIGGGTSSLHFNKGEFSKYNFGSFQYPLAGLLVNISLPKWNEKLSFDIETDISKLSFHGAYTDEGIFDTNYYNAYINIVSLQPSIALKYTFLN